MKVNLYMDIFPGWDGKFASAYSYMSPVKLEGVTRFKITVDVPEWAYQSKADGVLPVETFVEVDKDEPK